MKIRIHAKDVEAQEILRQHGYQKAGNRFEKEAATATSFLPVEDTLARAGFVANTHLPYNNPKNIVMVVGIERSEPWTEKNEEKVQRIMNSLVTPDNGLFWADSPYQTLSDDD